MKTHLKILTFEFLNSEYVLKRNSAKEVAKIAGCSPHAIFNNLKRHGIYIRNFSEERTGKLMPNISKSNKGKKFHPDECRCGFCVPKIGKDNPAWNGGTTSLWQMIRNLPETFMWRKACMERDGFICQECGKKSDGDLEVHHKNPFNIILKEFININSMFSPLEDKDTLCRIAPFYPDFWDRCNGITLCKNCHRAITSQVVKK